MKKFLKILATALIFYFLQIILEVLARLFLEYSGLMRSEDYSANSLFISAALYIGAIVLTTKIILIWAYLILFIIFSYFLKDKLRYSFINLIACLISALITFYYEDRLNVILSFYMPIIIASLVIVISDVSIVKYIKEKKINSIL